MIQVRWYRTGKLLFQKLLDEMLSGAVMLDFNCFCYGFSLYLSFFFFFLVKKTRKTRRMIMKFHISNLDTIIDQTFHA